MNLETATLITRHSNRMQAALNAAAHADVELKDDKLQVQYGGAQFGGTDAKLVAKALKRAFVAMAEQSKRELKRLGVDMTAPTNSQPKANKKK